MVTYCPSPVSWFTIVLTPGMRESESATLASGSLPRSSAESTSITPMAFFLTAIDVSLLTCVVCLVAEPRAGDDDLLVRRGAYAFRWRRAGYGGLGRIAGDRRL